MPDPNRPPVRVIVIPPDGPARAADADEAAISALIDGQREMVDLGDADAVMIVNAYGKTGRLPRNETATAFADAHRPGFARSDWVAGTAVIRGYDDDGLPADVPAALEAGLP